MSGTYSDNDLLQLVKAGNTQALTLLFKKYYQPLCRFSFVFIPEHEVAEELTANVFINLWENKHQIVIHTNLKAYLFRSVKNQAISYLRKNKAKTQPIDEDLDFMAKKDQTPETIYIENELNNEFVSAFQKLSPRARLAFKLHRFDGLKYTEIAEIMNISVSAVEKNITSALKILYKELFNRTKIL
ncbi:MAG: RNA polymerase sigma factor [Mangrovibacterium sp.]